MAPTGRSWPVVLLLASLLLDPCLVSTVRGHELGWGVDADDAKGVERFEAMLDELEANATANYGDGDQYKLARHNIGRVASTLMAITFVTILIGSWNSLYWQTTCLLKTDVPDMDVVQKMYDKNRAEDQLYFGERMSRFILQIRKAPPQRKGDGVEIRLYPFSPILRHAPGRRVVMVHEAQRDDHLEQGSPTQGIESVENAMIISIAPGHAGTRCREFHPRDPGMYSLYNMADEGGVAFDREIKVLISASQPQASFAYPASVLMVQPTPGHQWCKQELNYMYLSEQCDNEEDTFDGGDEDTIEEEILNWKAEARQIYKTMGDDDDQVQDILNPSAESVYVDAANLKIASTKTSSRKLGTIVVTSVVGVAFTYYMATKATANMSIFGFKLTLKDLPGRYGGVMGGSGELNQVVIESFDWLMIFNCVFPVILVGFLAGISSGLQGYLNSKPWAEVLVKMAILVFSVLTVTATYIWASQLGGQYHREIARRDMLVGYFNQFLAIVFFFDSLIRLAREHTDLTLKPILSDDAASFLLGSIGILGGTFGFITQARGGHANGGMCKFTALRDTLATDVLARFPLTDYTFDLHCDVVGGRFTPLDGNGTSMPLFEATMANVTGMHHTYDMSHCLLTCKERATQNGSPQQRATLIQCRDDGLVGCQWYAFFKEEEVCPTNTTA